MCRSRCAQYTVFDTPTLFRVYVFLVLHLDTASLPSGVVATSLS